MKYDLNDCHSGAFAFIKRHSAQAPGEVEFKLGTLGRDMKGHMIGCFTAFQKDASSHKANAEKNLDDAVIMASFSIVWFKKVSSLLQQMF